MKPLLLVLSLLLAGCGSKPIEHDKKLLQLWQEGWFKPKKGFSEWWGGCCVGDGTGDFLVFGYGKKRITYLLENGKVVHREYP